MKRSPISKISKKQRRKLANLYVIRVKWWEKSERDGVYLICGICKKAIVNFFELDSDHIIPGKAGGCRDDSPENLQPAHKWCNMRKGSSRPKYKPKYVSLHSIYCDCEKCKPQEIPQP